MNRRALLRGAIAAGVVATAGGAAWYAARRSEWAEVAWSRPLAGEADALHLAGDTLLVAGPGTGLAGFAAADGTRIWERDLGGDSIVPGRTGTPSITHNANTFAYRTVGSGGGSAGLRVAGLGDGAERWRRAFEGYLGPAVLTAGGAVVAVSDAMHGRGLGAYDGAGQRWWQAAAAADGPFDLAVSGDTLFVAARELAAFDARDGVRRWGFAAREGQVFGRPAVRGALVVALGMVYVDDDYGFRDQAVYAADAAAGELRWRYDASDGMLEDRAPLVAGGTVVAAHESGRLAGIDSATGRERWSAQHAALDVVALGGRVYLAGAEGVTALDAATGEVTAVLPAPDAYRLAASGSRLCVAAGGTLTAYRID
jgi:outer membrane protein assembly factor BamB